VAEAVQTVRRPNALELGLVNGTSSGRTDSKSKIECEEEVAGPRYSTRNSRGIKADL
jgi:hypothetical protein